MTKRGLKLACWTRKLERGSFLDYECLRGWQYPGATGLNHESSGIFLGRGGALSLAFRPSLRLSYVCPLSLCENTSSICLKRITSAGCRTGSTSPSSPRVPRRSGPGSTSDPSGGGLSTLCACSHGVSLWSGRVIWRPDSGNILGGAAPRWKPPFSLTHQPQAPSHWCSLVQPDSIYALSRILPSKPSPQILDNKIELNVRSLAGEKLELWDLGVVLKS